MTKAKVRAFIDAVIAIRDTATDEQAIMASALYPEWRPDTTYAAGQRILYDNVLYKITQVHTSQGDWPPDIVPSLYARVLVSDDGSILPWEQPDSTNPYMLGDKVTHNEKTWESLIDNNVWEPGAVGTETLWAEITE